MAKPVLSDISVTIAGIITFTADLMKVTESTKKPDSFCLICPTCTDPTKPGQRYECPSCKRLFLPGQLDKAREVNKALHRVTDDEVARVREPSLPEKEVHLNPVDVADFAQLSRPDGVTYRLRVERAREVAQMVHDLVESSTDMALVGEMNTGRGSEKCFMLTTWHGALLLQEIARPSDVIAFEAEPVTYKPQLLAQARAFLAMSMTEFTSETFMDRRKARMAELDATKAGEPTASIPAPGADALLAILEEQLRSQAS